VGTYLANPWGFYELHGNVWEWTIDILELYKKEKVIDPLGKVPEITGVTRGGGAWGKKVSATSNAKRKANLNDQYKYRGFRLCLTPPY
ncbi:MAG: hypothetical protein CMI27_00260, partial [Opitutae bacterium]|nr:hypothetical protein [Opitutae bacterium]